MSGPLKANAEDLRALSDFLGRLSAATIATGVVVAGYPMEVEIRSGTTLSIRWDADATQYAVDDRVGT